MAKNATAAKSATAPKARRTRTHFWARTDARRFTFLVNIVDGPMEDAVYRKRRKITRQLELRGDSTLGELHELIFKAYDRFDPHMFEFRIGGKDRHDYDGSRRFVLPEVLEDPFGDTSNCRDLTMTTLTALDMKVGDVLHYWFDFGDDWWHDLKLESIGDDVPARFKPRIAARTGESPPQYPDTKDYVWGGDFAPLAEILAPGITLLRPARPQPLSKPKKSRSAKSGK